MVDNSTSRQSLSSLPKSWVADLSVPYIEEKTRGEQNAWAVAREKGLDMVSVLPAGVLGPGFERPTPSTDFIEAFAKGAVRMGAPDVGFPVVDVRDVATVHRLAYEQGTSGARYIAMTGAYSAYDVALAVCKALPTIGRPLMKMPGFMTGLVPMFDAVMARIGGFPHTYTLPLHRSWRGREWRVDDSKTRAALGYAPEVGLEQTVADTVAQLKIIGRL